MDALALLGASTLTEGVRFLYDLAGDLLRRRLEPETGSDEGTRMPEGGAGVVTLAEPFVGTLDTSAYDASRLSAARESLRALRRELMEYADGEPGQPPNRQLLADFEQLRQLLEGVYGQSITFSAETGEGRSPSGTRLKADVDIAHIAGKVTGIRARTARGGELDARVKAQRVDSGSEVVGIDVDAID